MKKPTKEQFTLNGKFLQNFYSYAIEEWEQNKVVLSKEISAAIRYGIELSQTGKVKEGFPKKIVDDIVNTATNKFIDNLK